MKSTKAVDVRGMGCLVQTTTLEIDSKGSRRPVDTLAWLPGVAMDTLLLSFS